MDFAKSSLNDLSERVLGAAIEVHKTLGPGLLESAYQAALCYELTLREISFESEKALPVVYKNTVIECGYRIDLVIENQLILELKAVESLLPIHEAQLLSYLRLSDIKLGLLINFHQQLLKNGIKRMIL